MTGIKDVDFLHVPSGRGVVTATGRTASEDDVVALFDFKGTLLVMVALIGSLDEDRNC